MTKNQVHAAREVTLYAGLVLFLARVKKKNKEREKEYKKRSSNHLLLPCFATTLLTRELSLSLVDGSNRVTLILLHILETNILRVFSYFFDDQIDQDFFNTARDGEEEISEIKRENRNFRSFKKIVAKFVRSRLGSFFNLTTRKESLWIPLFGEGIPLGKLSGDEIRTSF